MNGNDVNLLKMSYDDVNSMRKKIVISKIFVIRQKILTETLNQVIVANEKVTKELVKNVNVNVENQIVNLGKITI